MDIRLCICQAGHCDDACAVCAELDDECPYRQEPGLGVTITTEDVGAAVVDGNRVILTGKTEDGREVVFSTDVRPMEQVLRNLLFGEDESITVELDDWQILNIINKGENDEQA